MSKAIVRFLAILGALWLIGAVIVLVAVIGVKGKVPSKTILEANFEQTFMEDVPDTPSAKLMLTEKQTLRGVVDAIDRGASDNRVVGMIAKIGAAPMGMAQTQEIRDAVQRFRAHKKFAVAYAETFGEFGPGNGAYYLATAFDHIYLQPSGDVGLTGIILESPFIKGTLAKLGMTFHGDHRYEYKNALNFYTETKYTGPHKEALTALMTSWFNQMKDGICQARQIAPEKFQALMDAGPYLGKEAVDAKLVDAVAYRDEVYGKVKSQAGDGAELLYLDKYLDPEADEVKIIVYPQPRTLLQSLIARRGAENSDREAVGQTLARILEVVQPMAQRLDAAGIRPQHGEQDDVLGMNPVLDNH